MTLQQLRYFTTVAKLQNLSRAAGLLHVSQSTLSKQISHLEEEFGTPFFDRNGRKIAINRAGLRFLECSSSILREIESAREDILAIADILKDRPDIMILSDEIYDRLVFEGEVTSIASVPGFKDRTIILDGFSKTYAMTGWRIGYGIMHPELAEKMALLMVNSNSCTASFTQRAALAALTGPQDAAVEMREAFKARRDWVVGALNEIPGLSCRMPGGAFYAFPNIESFGMDSHTFCSRLLHEGGVAAAWGTAFGSFGEGHFRISFANSLENLKIAVDRIAKFTKTL